MEVLPGALGAEIDHTGVLSGPNARGSPVQYPRDRSFPTVIKTFIHQVGLDGGGGGGFMIFFWWQPTPETSFAHPLQAENMVWMQCP